MNNLFRTIILIIQLVALFVVITSVYRIWHQPVPPIKKIFKDFYLKPDSVSKDYFIIHADNKTDTVENNGYNSPKYPYLTKERRMSFKENFCGENICLDWYLWIDGNIAESGYNIQINPKDVSKKEEQLKVYASKRIKFYSNVLNRKK